MMFWFWSQVDTGGSSGGYLTSSGQFLPYIAYMIRRRR